MFSIKINTKPTAYSRPEILIIVTVVLVPIAVIPPIVAKLTIPAINPYSIAVAPLMSFRNFLNIALSNVIFAATLGLLFQI
jgi:hypothetical protein